MVKKVWVTVCYPVKVEVEFDSDKVNNKEYVTEKRNEAKYEANNLMRTTGMNPHAIIHDAELPMLIE